MVRCNAQCHAYINPPRQREEHLQPHLHRVHSNEMVIDSPAVNLYSRSLPVSGRRSTRTRLCACYILLAVLFFSIPFLLALPTREISKTAKKKKKEKL